MGISSLIRYMIKVTISLNTRSKYTLRQIVFIHFTACLGRFNIIHLLFNLYVLNVCKIIFDKLDINSAFF